MSDKHIPEDGKCFFCGEQTNSLAGNPGRWALSLPVDPNEPGRPKTVCTGCVLERLRIAEEHLSGERRKTNASPRLYDSLYESAERLRELANRKPPHGYASWDENEKGTT